MPISANLQMPDLDFIGQGRLQDEILTTLINLALRAAGTLANVIES